MVLLEDVVSVELHKLMESILEGVFIMVKIVNFQMVFFLRNVLSFFMRMRISGWNGSLKSVLLLRILEDESGRSLG